MQLTWDDDLQSVEINTSTLGVNEIIAAPGAGKRIAIDFIQILPSGGANTLQIRDGTTVRVRYTMDDQQALTIENVIQHPLGIIKMADNSAFNLNLSAATLVTGFVRYRLLNN